MKTNDKLLSIVVPSYNVEKFLKDTLTSFVEESILDQLEVLVVDDGSVDQTAQIAEEFEIQYPQTFRLISKENGGHGSTINVGIHEAKGVYFKVVDGDDWVDTQALVALMKHLACVDADYIVTNYYEVNDRTKEKTPVTYEDLPAGKRLEFDAIAKKTNISMHALVLRTQLLKDLDVRLDEHCFYVDVEYILYPIPYVQNIVYFDLFVYQYRLAQQTQSVSMQGYQQHMQNHIDVIFHLMDYILAYQNRTHVDVDKLMYLTNRVAQMICSQVDIFTSYSVFDGKRRKQFQAFDAQVKEKSLFIYRRAQEYSGLLKMLRRTKFRCYIPLVLMSKVRNQIGARKA